jgi:hypothetical protein
MRKSVTFDYNLKGLTFHQGKKVSIKIARAKPALFDLITFFSILGSLFLLNLVMGFVGYTSSAPAKPTNNKKNN